MIEYQRSDPMFLDDKYTFDMKTTSACGMNSSNPLLTFSTSTDSLTFLDCLMNFKASSTVSLFLPSRCTQL